MSQFVFVWVNYIHSCELAVFKYSSIVGNYSNFLTFSSYVYICVERTHLVDPSFGDATIFEKKKWQKTKNQVFILLYTGKGGLSAGMEIFSISLFFSGDIVQNIKNEKEPTLSMPGLHRFKTFFLRYNFVTSSFIGSAPCCFKYCIVYKIIHQV